MCIIVDPPVFISIFAKDDPEHSIFCPIIHWIKNGSGKFIIGGEKYRKELTKKTVKLLLELEKTRKIVRIPDGDVDTDMKAIKKIESSKDFDDPHLVSLVRLTGCRLVALRDKRAHRFLKDGKFYSLPCKKPTLYTNRSHVKHLCKSNIVGPCCK